MSATVPADIARALAYHEPRLRNLTLLVSDDVARKLLKLGALGRLENLPTHGDRALMVWDHHLDERYVGVGWRGPHRRSAPRHGAVGHPAHRPTGHRHPTRPSGGLRRC